MEMCLRFNFKRIASSACDDWAHAFISEPGPIHRAESLGIHYPTIGGDNSVAILNLLLTSVSTCTRRMCLT